MQAFIAIQFCYQYLIGQISLGLLLYSHVPTAIVALLFGGFLLYKSRSLQSFLLFSVCLVFALWCFLDLNSWFAFLGAQLMMFTWSITDIFTILMFFLSYYFLYSFLHDKDLPLWQKIIAFMLILPTLYWTFFGSNLTAFDGNACQAIENDLVTNYPLFLEVVFLLSSVVLSVWSYFRTKDKEQKKKVVLAGVGVSAFLMFFFFSLFIADWLVSHGIWQDAYNVEIYGLFGMPLLLIFLGYLIVKYHSFNVKVFGAQALVVALVAIIGAEFFFVTSLVNQILVLITLVISLIFGYFLIKSVRREIEQREKIEALAIDLKKANAGQTNLIHVINHQLKGYLAKGRNVFAELLEEKSLGISELAKPMVKEGFDSLTEGVGFVQQILNGSSAESGTLQYNMQKIDLKPIFLDVAAKQKEKADAKKLSYTVTAPDGEFIVQADGIQIKEAMRNLIDNSIVYTPSGQVSVELRRAGGKVIMSVKDSGIGLDKEDMGHLFTKGGRGQESLKYNVNSTGYGLAFVMGVVKAHNGRVWAESNGRGKGSQFYMELPEVK